MRPLLIDSLPLERAVLESPLAPAMLGGLKPAGRRRPRHPPRPAAPAARRRTARAPAGLRGRDDRAAALADGRADAGGARRARRRRSPPRATIEGYDGVEQQIASIAGNGYDTAASHLTANVALWPRPVVLFAEPEGAGPASTHASATALTGAARAAIAPTFAFEQRDEAESAAILCRRGVRVRDRAARRPRRAAPRRAARLPPARAGPEDEGRDRRRSSRCAADRGPSGPTCSASRGSAQAAGAATPVDGVYRSDVTMAQLKRGPGFDDGEDNPRTSGTSRSSCATGASASAGPPTARR